LSSPVKDVSEVVEEVEVAHLGGQCQGIEHGGSFGFSEAITPWFDYLCGSARKNIYAAARIDLHHSKGFMGLGQNRLPN